MFLADLLLNQNISANESLYSNRHADTRLLLGTRYALLRREFWKWRGWKRNVPDVATNILVTLGGSDPDNVTRQILQSLLPLKTPGLRVKAVIGAANPHGQSLRDLADSSLGRFELIGNTSEMPELMAWADLAVAAGGSTCWELALMGLPMVLLVLADNQRAIAAGLEREGAAIDLGWHNLLESVHMTKVLGDLLNDPIRRRLMSDLGRKLVDGCGASRVATILMKNSI
jgi:spore coat polysaccharide biosynthesis predicted glycosyltransferase SpsG